MAEIYVSTDVEADGPIPGPNSMLSFGSAAYAPDKTLIGTFSANLLQLPGAEPDPGTMAWWKTQPDAWAECRRDPRDPAEVMPEYVGWLKALPGPAGSRATRLRRLERNAPDPLKAALDSLSDEDLSTALAALRVAETREIAAISLASKLIRTEEGARHSRLAKKITSSAL